MRLRISNPRAMKTTNVAIIALACTALSPLHGGEAGAQGAPKLRPSHADLVKRFEKRTRPLSVKGVESIEAGRLGRSKERIVAPTLVGRSTILSHGGRWTLVPKGAVLFVPAVYRGRIAEKPSGKLVPWIEFCSRNRGWIHTETVTMEQARGEAVLSEEVTETHKRLGRLVVAVLHGGPISVKAPAEEDGELSRPSEIAKE